MKRLHEYWPSQEKVDDMPEIDKSFESKEKDSIGSKEVHSLQSESKIIMAGVATSIVALVSALVYTSSGKEPAAIHTTQVKNISKKEGSEERIVTPQKNITSLHDKLQSKLSKTKGVQNQYSTLFDEFQKFSMELSAGSWENMRIFCMFQTIKYSKENYSEHMLLDLVRKEHLNTQELELFSALIWQEMVPVKDANLR